MKKLKVVLCCLVAMVLALPIFVSCNNGNSKIQKLPINVTEPIYVYGDSTITLKTGEKDVGFVSNPNASQVLLSSDFDGKTVKSISKDGDNLKIVFTGTLTKSFTTEYYSATFSLDSSIFSGSTQVVTNEVKVDFSKNGLKYSSYEYTGTTTTLYFSYLGLNYSGQSVTEDLTTFSTKYQTENITSGSISYYAESNPNYSFVVKVENLVCSTPCSVGNYSYITLPASIFDGLSGVTGGIRIPFSDEELMPSISYSSLSYRI